MFNPVEKHEVTWEIYSVGKKVIILARFGMHTASTFNTLKKFTLDHLKSVVIESLNADLKKLYNFLDKPRK